MQAISSGTSLSKYWNLAERFSEDIDIAINREFFGITNVSSKNQREKLRKSSSKYIQDELVVELTDRLSEAEITGFSVEIDTMTLTGALALLAEYGYILSKAKLYKLTASGNIPCRKFGQKLVFSRKDILSWAEGQTKPKRDFSEVSLTLARSVRRKKQLR